MPGAVPLDDLPDSLRGTVVPADDMPGADMSTSGGPVGRRRRNTRGQQMYQDTMAAARGQSRAAGGLLDLAVNSVVNAPADLLNAGANLLGAAVDPYASVATKLLSKGPTNFEAQARANPAARVPLLTQAGEETAGAIGEAMPDFVKNMDPLVGDVLTVGGGLLGARASGLLPKGPVLNEFSRNVARNRGRAPYQQSPVADVAQRYTVVPEDVQHSAGMVNAGDIRGSTRASLGPDVTGSEVPVANIRKATANAVSDMPAPGGLLDANGRVDAGMLRKAMDEQSVPYQQVAQLPAPQANTLAGRLRQAWEARGGSLKGDAVAESRLLPLMDEAGAPLPTGELLSRWKEINGYAASLRKQVGEGSAAAQIKSGDLRLIADAILDEVDSRAAAFANPQLTESLKQARVNLGRLHSLEDALDTVGWVDPAKLKAMGERGVPLSGGLAQVAADVAAAPRSLRPMQSAINAQDSALDQFGRQPNSWLRNVAGHVGGNWLARRGVDSLNRELRAGSGVLRQPVPETPVPLLYGPNAGPQPPAPVPQAPPGLFAAEPPAPRAPLLPDAGRPAPAGPSFNELLADSIINDAPEAYPGPGAFGPDVPPGRGILPAEAPRRDTTLVGGDMFARDLQLEGQVPRGPVPQAPSARPLDVIDFEPVEAPSLLGSRGAPMTQDDWRLANGLQLEGPPEPFNILGEPPPPRPLFGPDDEFPGPAAPVLPQGPAPGGAGGAGMEAFSDLLTRHVRNGDVEAGALAQALLDAGDEAPLPLRRAAEVYARGEGSGAAAAQRAFLGEVDRFAGPVGFVDEVPSNLSRAPAGGAAFADELTLADTGPVAPRADVTESLPSQGSALFPDDFLLPGARRVESPTGFVDLLETPDGALQIKRTKTAQGQEGRGFGQERLLNAAREAQAQGKPLNSDVEVNPDARRLYEKLREKGQLEFDGPFDDGGPVFRNIRPRGDAQPAPAGISDLLARYDSQDGGEFPWMSDDEFLRDLADAEGLPPAVRSKVDEYLERRESDYREDAGRGDSDEFAEQTIQAVRRLLGG